MKYQFQKIFNIAVALGLFLLPVANTFAYEGNADQQQTGTTQTRISNWEERNETRQELIEKKQSELADRISKLQEKERIRCEKINSNVEKIISNYDEKVAKHIEKYQNIVIKVETAVNRIEEKGIDVTMIRSQLETLNQMILNMHQNREQYINTLRDSQNYICGESEGEFKNRIQTARTELNLVKNNAEEIKNYMENTIRPELLRLREQLSEKD